MNFLKMEQIKINWTAWVLAGSMSLIATGCKTPEKECKPKVGKGHYENGHANEDGTDDKHGCEVSTSTGTSTATVTNTSTSTSTSTATNPSTGYQFPANPGLVCTVDKFAQATEDQNRIKKLDLLFVMDHSGSMADDWARVAQNIQNLVKELPADMDINYSVLLANASAQKGKLFSAKNVPVVLSNKSMKVADIANALQKTFSAGMNTPDDNGSGEASFLSLYHAASTYAKDNQKLGFFRPDAALSVLFMSDEQEIGFAFPNPQAPGLPNRCDAAYEDNVRKLQYTNKGIDLNSTYNALKALKGDMPLMTHAFVNITKEDLFTRNSPKASCLYDSLGYGYFEMVAKTKGVLFSIQADKAQGMKRCGEVIRDSLEVTHEFKLSKAADKVNPATIVAAVDAAKVAHEYKVNENSVYLANAGVAGSKIEIQHCEPVVRPDWNLIAFTGSVGQRAASLNWKTPEYATAGKVLYGTSASALSGSASHSGKATDHVVTIEGLSPNTVYYFQGVSTDEFGLEKKSSVISLRTQPDWNVVASAGQPSRNSVSVSWKTPEYATVGKVAYGSEENALVNQSAETAAATEHTVVLNNLEANETYYLQVSSRDEYGLEKKSAVLSVTTLNEWGIVGLKGDAGLTSVNVSWQTPEYVTEGKLLYGASANALTQVAAAGTGNEHSVLVNGLNQNTTYYFQAVGKDDLGLEKKSNVISVKTTYDWNILNFAGTAAVDSVSVSFRTPDFSTAGQVRWGLTAESLGNVVNAGSGFDHAATIAGLSADTIYYFQAVAKDENGLGKASGVVAIRTEKKPVEPTPLPVWTMSGFAGNATKNSVSVSYKTAEYATVGKVRYGLSENALNQEVNESAAVNDHSAVITGLSPDTLYYFQAEAKDEFGQVQTTSAVAIRTLPEAVTEPTPIGNWELRSFDATTTANSMSLIWATPGAETKATIKVGLSADNLTVLNQEVTQYADTHVVTVSGLNADTIYYVKVIAADKNGRTVESVVLMKKTKAQ
jgi:hypothetical protein